MGVIYVKGNIFDSPCAVLTCPVNTVGVMGAGLAMQFRDRYHSLLSRYKLFCNTNLIVVGKPMLYRHDIENYILLFPTKKDWRDPSNIEYVKNGLDYLIKNDGFKDLVKNREFSIAFPKLGCGLGGLEWQDVRPLMQESLEKLDCKVEIYV